MSDDAWRELSRALLARAGDGAAIEEAHIVDWGSLTFEGHRHELRLTLPTAAADTFADGLGEAEFSLRGHIVADIVIVGCEIVEDRTTIAIEALTLLDR